MSDFIEDHAVQIDHGGFKEAVDDLEHLIESDASENVLQKHLEKHPYILSQQFAHCHHVFPKVALGIQYETDFMCLDIPSSGKEWNGIELECPNKKVITKQGRKTADLEHAIQQIRDWRAWVTENLNYARQSRENNGLGLTDIAPRFFGHVIIGRRTMYNNKFNELRRQLFRDELITIHSWDGIVEYARNKAKIFSAISDSFNIIQQQQELIKKMEEINRLKELISDIKQSEVLLSEKNKNLSILEEQYQEGLAEFGYTLPESLRNKITALLNANTAVSAIITQVEDEIPDQVPQTLLADYISAIMTKQQSSSTYGQQPMATIIQDQLFNLPHSDLAALAEKCFNLVKPLSELLGADIGAVSLAHKQTVEYASKAGWDDDSARDISRGCRQAVANAIEAACRISVQYDVEVGLLISEILANDLRNLKHKAGHGFNHPDTPRSDLNKTEGVDRIRSYINRVIKNRGGITLNT